MKKILFIIFVVLVVLTLLFSLLFRSQQYNPINSLFPTPTPVGPVPLNLKTIDYSNLFPDPDTARQVTDLLQNPLNTKSVGDMTVASFPTDVENRDNLLYEKNNTAQYIKQEVTTDNTTLADFISTHPNSESFQLFDTSHTPAGFIWYVFPKYGIAFLANKDSGGYVIQIIYFASTTKEEFLKTDAKLFNLLSTDPTGQDTQESFEETP